MIIDASRFDLSSSDSLLDLRFTASLWFRVSREMNFHRGFSLQ